MKKSFASFKFEHLWAIIIIAGIFGFANMAVIRPNDFWFHLAYGRGFIETGQLPVNEQFSFTHTGPYPSVYNYWLAQVFYYLVYKLGGAALVILVSSILFTSAYHIILRLGLNKTSNWRSAALGAFFAVVLGVTSANIRPQLLAYPLLAGALHTIDRFRNSDMRWPWGLTLSGIMVIWVNSHGTFFIPFILIAFWGIERAIQAYKEKNLSPLIHPITLSGYTLLGTLINPRGVGAFDFLYSMGTASTINRYVSEWQSTDLSNLTGQLFFVALILLVLLIVLSRQRLELAEWLSLIFFTLLAFKYIRAVNWFGLTQATLFAKSLHSFFNRHNRNASTQNNKPLFNVVVAGFMVFLAFATLPWFRTYLPLKSDNKNLLLDTPFDAVDFMLQNDLPANVFLDMGFGSYLIWAAPQDYKVFIDPRFEYYPEAVWDSYINVSHAKENWESQLEAYHVGTLLLHQTLQHPLVEAVENSNQWELVYEDPLAIIFVYAP